MASQFNEYDIYNNAHSWCVLNGKIIDPTPMPFELTAYCMNLDLQQPVYEEFDIEKQKEIMELVVYKYKNLPKEEKRLLKEEPQLKKCFYNALIYKLNNPEVKIRYGKMGWRYKNNNNDVWWEFGDTDTKNHNNYKLNFSNKVISLAKMNNKTFYKLLKQAPDTDEYNELRDVVKLVKKSRGAGIRVEK